MSVSNKVEIIAQKDQIVTLYLHPDAPTAVQIAAKTFLEDLKKICGCKPQYSTTPQQAQILVGMFGKDKDIDALMSENGIHLDDLKEKETLRWECYLHQLLPDGRLLIVGNERRGTIFGLYDLSEQFGVSPWYDFADVPIKKKNTITLPQRYCKRDWPAVEYRGIFLNDEEELCAWAKKHTQDGTIGPQAYRRIFELLLRLKGNYIWPVMHVNYFNENPMCGRLADEMGIVVGTTHCDMLMRSNQNEWDPWVRKKGYHDLQYDYSIEGENRCRLQEYWRESVEQNASYEVSYTVGMRGIHDSGFLTSAIDQNDDLTEQQKQQARVKLLQTIIHDQREILKQTLGEQKASDAMQIFVPYKEVLPLYDAGLDLPENITVMWVNDNFGHIRRYPSDHEKARKGANALYFHSSYWSPPPYSYLFINSIPLAQTGNELKKAYQEGIRRIWVDNIGALKPLEQDMEFFIRYGWDAARPEAIIHNIPAYLEDWFNSNFSGGIGKECADIYQQYAQITNVCKVEHLYRDAFSQTAYGDEAGRRVQKLKALYHRVLAVQDGLPKAEQEAFFQLLGMKVQASYYINSAYYYADRSRLCYAQGKMQAADRYLRDARAMMGYKRQMLYYYNKVMCGGKWDGILTPEAFPPPASCLYPDAKPALRIGACKMGVIVWGDKAESESPVLYFDPNGIACKWVELFNKGAGKFRFEIQNDCQDWLSLSQTRGEVADEVRILVQRKGAPKKGSLLVKNCDSGKEIEILVRPKVDGWESVAACDYTEITGNGDGWIRIQGLDRMCGDCMEANGNGDALCYRFTLPMTGDYTLELTRYLTLDATAERFSIELIFAGQKQTIYTQTTDEWRGNWENSVRNNGEKLYCTFKNISAGEHTLSISTTTPYITLGKITMYAGRKECIQPCQLGPNTPDEVTNECIPSVDAVQMAQDTAKRYGVTAWQLPAPNLIFAGHHYWDCQHLFQVDEQYPQQLAPPRYPVVAGETKDICAMFGKGRLCEQSGKLCIETEYALENSEWAWLEASVDGECWTHLQAETDGGSGLAMYVEPMGRVWQPRDAPSMHYKINIANAGNYYVWLLVRFDDCNSDTCYLGIDDTVQPASHQYSKGNLFTYSTQFQWVWTLLSELELEQGDHTLSIYAGKSGLRIDRIYLTQTKENPPNDLHWKASERKE